MGFEIDSPMRWGASILSVALLVTGCASAKRSANSTPVQPLRDNRPSGVAALVFDPPVIADQEELDLSRQYRDPSAFVGYESLTATYFYVRTDDRQLDDRGHRDDRFERRSVSTRVGVSYR